MLTGWNLVDFDLTVLQRRFRALALPFNLGRSSDSSWYQEGEIWGGSRMVVHGRQVLDALHLIRGTLQRFDDYRLETVARQVLGRGKRFAGGGDAGESMPEVILRAYREDRTAFCEYCLEDSRLVRDLLEGGGADRADPAAQRPDRAAAGGGPGARWGPSSSSTSASCTNAARSPRPTASTAPVSEGPLAGW